ncbi:MAG TPA: hypothetical protein VF082_12725 [Jiangellaceae bacterium]
MGKQDVTFELFYDGDWHELDNVLAEPFDMVRGRSSEDDTTPAQRVRLHLHDPDQRYNPLNPTSPLWGLVGPNTPLRISVDGTARWCGEIASWVPRRTLDYDLPAVLAGGVSARGKAWIEIDAEGVLRRLGQGQPPVLSAIRRTLTDNNPSAYWPLEDGVDARLAASGLLGGTPLTILTGVIDFETDEGPAGSAGYARVVEDAASIISGPVQMADTGEWQLVFWAKGEGAEVGYDEVELVSVTTDSADATQWWVTLTDSGGGLFAAVVSVYDSVGGTTDTLATGTTTEPGLLDGDWHLIQLAVAQDGADVDYALWIDGELAGSQTITTANAGLPAGVSFPAEPSQVETTNVGIAHVALWDSADASALATVLEPAGRGYDGETAGPRIQGVAAEDGVTFTSAGTITDSTIMGPQTPDTTVGIWADAAAADMGILSEPADAVGIHYRVRTDLLNQEPALTLAYDSGAFTSLDPVIDDQGRANDVEVRRPSGSSARATLETGGPNAVDRIGRMTAAPDANVQTDWQLAAQAGWRLHVASWPGLARYPQVTIDLVARDDLVADVEALTFGDVIRITGLEHDPVDLMIQGWTEHVETHRRSITFNCTPAGPWVVAEVTHADYGYIGSDGSTLNSAFNAGGSTSMSVAVAAGYPLWTTGSVDFDVMTGGARLHVTSIAGASSPQTFTVTQTPVNGVVKTVPSGSKVDVHPPAYIGM